MKTHVEFKSNNFPPYPGEEEQINPGRWGRRLAEFLSAELNGHGVDVDSIFPEDWGWVIPINHESFNMFVGVGNYDEFENGFLVCIEPSKPFIRKGFFKKIDTTIDVESVSQALNAIISSCTEIYDIRWGDETDF